MLRVVRFTATLVVLISVCQPLNISTFEADDENDNNFDYNEIDFESLFTATNGTDDPIDDHIEEDSYLDTVRLCRNIAKLST